MMSKKRAWALLALSLGIAVIVGGALARFTEKVIYRTHQSHITCKAVDNLATATDEADLMVTGDSKYVQQVCGYAQAPDRYYGWPVTARRVTIPDPSIGPPDDNDVDYSWPVIGYLTDGVFANWAFYSICLFVIIFGGLAGRQVLKELRS